MGQLKHNGGSVLKNPVIVTVTWAGDDKADQLEAFGDTVGAGQYWKDVTSEYAVAAATSGDAHHVRITEPAAGVDERHGARDLRRRERRQDRGRLARPRHRRRRLHRLPSEDDHAHAPGQERLRAGRRRLSRQHEGERRVDRVRDRPALRHRSSITSRSPRATSSPRRRPTRTRARGRRGRASARRTSPGSSSSSSRARTATPASSIATPTSRPARAMSRSRSSASGRTRARRLATTRAFPCSRARSTST